MRGSVHAHTHKTPDIEKTFRRNTNTEGKNEKTGNHFDSVNNFPYSTIKLKDSSINVKKYTTEIIRRDEER